MKIRFLAVLLLAAALPCVSFGQAQWNGFQPQQTSQSPFALRIADGDMSSALGTWTALSNRTLLFQPNTTNYIYIDFTQEPPVLTQNTTGFPATSVAQYRIAVVVTNSAKITSVTDARLPFNNLLYPGGGGGGGGTIGGSGTPGTIPVFINSTTIGSSTCTDDGINPTRCPNGMYTAAGGNWAEWVVDTGGVVANNLVCRSSSQKAVICPAGTTTGVLGVAQKTVSAGGTVEVCFAGKCNPIASNNTTAGDWLIPSTSVAGEVDDVGATKPTTGIQTIPAESSVSAGNAVLTTFLSPDTIAASTNNNGTILPCAQYGLTYYSLSGSSTTVTCITPPTANGNYLVNYNVTANAAVAPTASLAGVPINAQTGTTYTKLYSDRVSLDTFNNASPVAVTVPQAGTTGFTSNYADANWNLGAGLATFTPTTSQINGASSQILPSKWFGFLYSNNSNYFMPIVPTLAAFPSCPDSGGNHLNFTTATGAISCGTSGGGGGGITSINTVATGPNVNIVGAGNTAVSTVGNTVTVSGGTTGNIAGTWVNIGTNYSVQDSDNTYRLRGTASGIVWTLGQPGTITQSPVVGLKFNVNAQGNSTITSSAYTQTSGNQGYLAIIQGGNVVETSVTDSRGDVYTLVATSGDTQASSRVYYCANLVSSGSTTMTINWGSSLGFSSGVILVELTGTTHDNSSSASQNGIVTLSLTNPIHFQNAMALAGGRTSAFQPSPPFIEIDTLSNGNVGSLSYSLFANNNTSSVNMAGNNTTVYQSILSISSHPAFARGWFVTITNASNGWQTVCPTSSVINGVSPNGTCVDQAPNSTCTYESNGVNWDRICGATADVQTVGVGGLSTTIFAAAQTAGTSSIGATTIVATPAAPIKNFLMWGYADVTVIGSSCAGNTTVVLNAIYTDPNGAGATTRAIGTFTITTNGTVGDNFGYPPLPIRAKASTNIQFSTTYTAGGSCSPAPTVQVTPILQAM